MEQLVIFSGSIRNQPAILKMGIGLLMAPTASQEIAMQPILVAIGQTLSNTVKLLKLEFKSLKSIFSWGSQTILMAIFTHGILTKLIPVE